MTPKQHICRYCQSNIKVEEDAVLCPECSTPYHSECWAESGGCAVYGCSQSRNAAFESGPEDEALSDMFVNIEFLINSRRYIEAMTECKRVLKVDKRNIEAKRLYNRAVNLINTKTRFIENGDAAFNSGDYKSAEIYYANSLKYTDEEESDFIKTRIDVIKEKVPYELKRKRINNFLVAAILLLILGSVSYLTYYFIILKEDREYASIEKDDTPSDIQNTEIQLSRYERFIRMYPKGDNSEKASDKVNAFSGSLADHYYKSDWRNAKKFLDKMDKEKLSVRYTDLYNKIYGEAEKEYKTLLLNAKKLDTQRKYSEAQIQIDRAVSIINDFPGSKMAQNINALNNSLSLLKKKSSSLLKYSTIENEINDKVKELKSMSPDISSSAGSREIKAIVLEEISSSTVKARNVETGGVIVLKAPGYSLTEGEYISLNCVNSGTVNLTGEDNEIITVPLYTSAGTAGDAPSAPTAGNYERESIRQRIDYLRSQKEKLDSILNLKL
jgi:tetratricopeptide (TPR) repeat protein